jgi:hypothetical protein
MLQFGLNDIEGVSLEEILAPKSRAVIPRLIKDLVVAEHVLMEERGDFDANADDQDSLNKSQGQMEAVSDESTSNTKMNVLKNTPSSLSTEVP